MPLEQTQIWADYQQTIDGRKPWGVLAVLDQGEPVAMLSLIEYQTHGYRYLRSAHGPVWFIVPNPGVERNAVRAIREYVHRADSGIVFVRLDLWTDTGTHPVLSTVPYDTTVVVDLAGGADAILERMRKRGRRDVRKALRESAAVCADETNRAVEDFSEYYSIMVDTAHRDGFMPAPLMDYVDMMEALGHEHCRVFAARIKGRVVAWLMVTIYEGCAVYYYACASADAMSNLVPDKLIYTMMCDLGNEGCVSVDLMGVGSDFAPSLHALTTFKSKFAQETTPVAPARDVPVRKSMYRALAAAKSVRSIWRNITSLLQYRER
nr:GNAT family N-acetyltransferase [Bifidobacterium saguini]